jgi:hypothetical protein
MSNAEPSTIDDAQGHYIHFLVSVIHPSWPPRGHVDA